jgi:hypothetical protein
MPNNLRLGQGMALIFRTERDPSALLQRLPEIISLANKEKEALGFLPEAAYRDAIERSRLVAMCATNGGKASVVGFILVVCFQMRACNR